MGAKNIDSKKILFPGKSLGSKAIFDSKSIFVPKKFLGPRKVDGPPKVQTILGVNKFWP